MEEKRRHSRSISPIDEERLTNGQRLRLLYSTLKQSCDYQQGFSSTDGGKGLARCMLLLGHGGTGKWTAINAIRVQLQEEWEMVMAPTGKAATVIGGSTIFNHKHGLCLPIKDESFKKLPENDRLLELQQKWKDVKIIFIDEFSIISLKHLHWIDHRLRQIKGIDTPFGGLITVLLGDTGQLPPVGGKCLWNNKETNNEFELQGRTLYQRYFKSVVILTENKRIANDEDAKEYKDHPTFNLRAPLAQYRHL